MKTLPKMEINDEVQTSQLGLEESIREFLTERAEPVTSAEFEKSMKAIADGN